MPNKENLLKKKKKKKFAIQNENLECLVGGGGGGKRGEWMLFVFGFHVCIWNYTDQEERIETGGQKWLKDMKNGRAGSKACDIGTGDGTREKHWIWLKIKKILLFFCGINCNDGKLNIL